MHIVSRKYACRLTMLYLHEGMILSISSRGVVYRYVRFGLWRMEPDMTEAAVAGPRHASSAFLHMFGDDHVFAGRKRSYRILRNQRMSHGWLCL